MRSCCNFVCPLENCQVPSRRLKLQSSVITSSILRIQNWKLRVSDFFPRYEQSELTVPGSVRALFFLNTTQTVNIKIKSFLCFILIESCFLFITTPFNFFSALPPMVLLQLMSETASNVFVFVPTPTVKLLTACNLYKSMLQRLTGSFSKAL